MTPILLGATWAHWGNGWMFGYDGGGWEYPLYLSVLGIAQFLLGDAGYALSPSRDPLPGRSAGAETALARSATGGPHHV